MEEAEGSIVRKVALLRTHPGVGPVVSLSDGADALGPVERFTNSRKLVSYLGLNPREHSSGGHQRLGAISKLEGNEMMRWLLVEAALLEHGGTATIRSCAAPICDSSCGG